MILLAKVIFAEIISNTMTENLKLRLLVVPHVRFPVAHSPTVSEIRFAGRFLGWGRAIRFGKDEGRSLFGRMRCDRILECNEGRSGWGWK